MRLRRMSQRARYLKLPFVGAWIELDASSLGLETILDLSQVTLPADLDPLRREQILAKVQEQQVYVASALVHEGVHALEGLSWSRARDELAAYTAECQFLSNVHSAAGHLLVKSVAKSLHADAVRDALQQEGLSLPPLAP